MPFAICNEIFKDWKLEDAMTFAGKAGYDGFEIAPFTLGQSYVTEVPMDERRRIRQMAERIGIQITGIHWVLVKAEGMYMNHPEADVRKRSAKYFCDLVDFCGDVGGHIIVVGSPNQRQVGEGVSQEQAMEWARETFSPSIQRALDKGITICLEPLAPSETNFINTASEAISFIKHFRSSSFKIILDVKAMCSMGKPIPEIIGESWPHFAYFHANDRNLKGPGFGEVDFKPIAAALREVGYDGFVSVEVFNFDEGPEAIATRSINYLKESFALPAGR